MKSPWRCMVCSNVIQEPHLYQVKKEMEQLQVSLKGRLVDQFGATELDEVEAKADAYTEGPDTRVDRVQAALTGRNLQTSVYETPATKTKRDHTKLMYIAFGVLVLGATVAMVVVGTSMLSGSDDNQTKVIGVKTSSANERADAWPNGKVKVRWHVKIVDGAEIRDGLFEEFHENGKPKTKGQYTDGVETGVWIGWHDNGKKSFHGAYKNGNKDGRWIHWHPNGRPSEQTVYDNGMIQKDRRLWYSSGQEESYREYENGLAHGQEVIWYRNGKKKIDGEWKDDQKTGLWLEYAKDGTVERKTHWKHGVQDGIEEVYWPNGERKLFGKWKDGVLDGVWIAKYRTGVVKSRGRYVNGQLDGMWSEWRGDKTPLSTTVWKVGIRHGNHTEYAPDGSKIYVANYQEGVLKSATGFFDEVPLDMVEKSYESGERKERWTEKDGVRVGWYYRWHENGEVAENGVYRNGKKDAEWCKYDDTGLLEITEIWNNGTLERSQ